MTLLELCEPLFQYLCTLNREARSGGRRDYAFVRADVKRLLDELMQKASAEVQLAAQARKLELPLIFFVDAMVCQSKLPFVVQWNQNRLAKERNELAGDEKFFVLLEETINDHSDAASERLAVFYVCLWLGMTGPYDRKPDKLRSYIDEILPRIGHLMDRDLNARICADAYKQVRTESFIEPPSNRIVLVGVMFLFLCLSVLVVYGVLYRNASQALHQSIEGILDHKKPGQPAAPQ